MKRSDRGACATPNEAVVRSLHRAWPPPRDTYITEGFPELLTRLALVPVSRTGVDEAGDAHIGMGIDRAAR